jgi:hypothetical protein
MLDDNGSDSSSTSEDEDENGEVTYNIKYYTIGSENISIVGVDTRC